MGLEAAVIAGPFHAAGEGYWQTVHRRGSTDPTYFGGYAELGMVLTPGDRRGYKDGAFDRLKPSRPITEGGIGAIELNARYDHLDLNDAGLVRSEEHTSELQSLMRNSYAVFCLKTKSEHKQSPTHAPKTASL